MEFGFDDDQLAFRDAVRDLLDKECTPATVRAAWEAPAGARSSFVKLWWSELDVALHETALDILGPDAELDGPWSKGWQFALSGPIYAGTNEIQRNIAAERVLGLPRK